MLSPFLDVRSVREIPNIATLFSASRGDDSAMCFEFIDAVDPGTPRSSKWVIMVSTQFGCAVGCRMCDAGASGYRGNLTQKELDFQIQTVLSRHPEIPWASVPKIKVHFARMGEPSFNPAVLDCLEDLGKRADLPGLMPSISSVAPECAVSRNFFTRLLEVKNRLFSVGRFQLQFSIHSTDSEARAALIPIRKWSFDQIAEFGARWHRSGDRLITLNFALAEDMPCDPDVVKEYFSPQQFLVKFTPIHPTQRAARNHLTWSWYEPPPRISELKNAFEERDFQVIVNPPWPEEVGGEVSCGQLSQSLGNR